MLIPVAVFLGYEMGKGGQPLPQTEESPAKQEDPSEDPVTAPVQVSLGNKLALQDSAPAIQASYAQIDLAPANGYLARVDMNSPESLEAALLRAEALYEAGRVSPDDEALAFVLHGPEVAIFLKENYLEHKHIVDLAAKLSAFDVLNVQVCETRMGVLGASKDSLPAFVDTVPFGPAEVTRLLEEEQYLYF